MNASAHNRIEDRETATSSDVSLRAADSAAADADMVAIADVYSAGEDPIPGASRDDLVAGLIAHGHRHARALQDESELARLVKEQARPGDMVVCLGAGTISAWANALPAKLLGKAA